MRHKSQACSHDAVMIGMRLQSRRFINASGAKYCVEIASAEMRQATATSPRRQ
jgi:hypothetical protein